MQTVLQIVPRLPPSISGVADYAALLADELERSHQIRTRFLVADPAWTPSDKSPVYFTERLGERTAAALLERMDVAAAGCDAVVLHYVGYGYDPRGCPWWLADGLERWKQRPSALRLVTMFHELYATGFPWQRSFWSSPAQRAIGRRLAVQTDQHITNLNQSARWLNRVIPKTCPAVTVLPVFSNMGEPARLSPFSARLPALVLFGGGKWLDDALGKWKKSLLRTCRALGIESVIAIGSNSVSTPAFPIPVQFMGTLPPTEVSALMGCSKAAFFDYHDGYLGKSTIFSAYCAHGLLTVMPTANHSTADGLHRGRHYLDVADVAGGVDSATADRIASEAHQWYQSHDLARTAATFASVIPSQS